MKYNEWKGVYVFPRQKYLWLFPVVPSTSTSQTKRTELMIMKHLYNKGIKEAQQTQGLSGPTKVNTFMSHHKF